jgi:PAS domain S-box-containing protein
MEGGHSIRLMEVGRSVFVQVLDSIDAFVGLLSVDGIVIEMNVAALAATGLDRADVVGRPFADMSFWNWSEQVQAEVRRDLAVAASGRVQRADRTLHLGESRYIHFECSWKPVLDEGGRVTHLVWSGADVAARVRQLEGANAALGREIEERRRAETRVVAGEERLRRQLEELETIYRQAPVGLCLIGRDFRFLRINKKLAEINGVPAEAHIGHCIEEIVPDLAKTAIPILRRVFETGEPLENVESEGETARSPGTSRFWTQDFYPLKNDAGVVWAVGAIVRDVTERKHAEDQRELLLAELEHRVKNTLASVMSIAAHTLVDGKELAVARDAFIGRLHALSHAHDLLAAGNWRGADLEQVVRRAVEPYAGIDGARGSIEGPAVFLQPRAAVTLGMIVHELATNAAKYGSLSVPEGRLDVNWSLQGSVSGADAMLRLVWSETGGPPVTPPSRSGFGRTLIERGLKHELGGGARLEFHPAGLSCDVSLPLHRAAATRASPPSSSR